MRHRCLRHIGVASCSCHFGQITKPLLAGLETQMWTELLAIMILSVLISTFVGVLTAPKRL